VSHCERETSLLATPRRTSASLSETPQHPLTRGSVGVYIYLMPLSGPCLRLNTLRCNNLYSTALHLPSTRTVLLADRTSRQRAAQPRIFVSCADQQRCRPVPWLRSPLQWSHIVQLVRPGTAVSTMGANGKANGVQKRGHAGHSHGHHHHHDNTYLTSSNKNDPGVRITRIGLYVNLGMAIGKGLGGYAFNSQA
jgi:hypothetical protein